MTIPEFKSEIDALNSMLEKRFDMKISLICWNEYGTNQYNLSVMTAHSTQVFKKYWGDSIEDCISQFHRDFGCGHAYVSSDITENLNVILWEVGLPTFESLEELKMKLELLEITSRETSHPFRV